MGSTASPGKESPRIVRTGTAAAFTASLGCSWSHGEESVPWQSQMQSMRGLQVPEEQIQRTGYGSFGDKAFLARAAFLVASPVLAISEWHTAATPCSHSLFPSPAWQCTKLKPILLRLPLQLWHLYPLHPSWSSIPSCLLWYLTSGFQFSPCLLLPKLRRYKSLPFKGLVLELLSRQKLRLYLPLHL